MIWLTSEKSLSPTQNFYEERMARMYNCNAINLKYIFMNKYIEKTTPFGVVDLSVSEAIANF